MDPDPTPDLQDLLVVPLQDTVLFPGQQRVFMFPPSPQLEALKDLPADRRWVVMVALRHRRPLGAPVLWADLCAVGTVSRIEQVAPVPESQADLLVFATGHQRARLVSPAQAEPTLRGRVEREDFLAVEGAPTPELLALVESVKKVFSEVVVDSPTLSNDLLPRVQELHHPGDVANVVSALLPGLSLEERQALLETRADEARLRACLDHAVHTRESLRLQKAIEAEAERRVVDAEHKTLLREQLHSIQDQLKEGDDLSRDVEALRKKVEAAHLPEEALTEARRELGRLRILWGSAEYPVAVTYLEFLCALPWEKTTAAPVDLRRAREILDEDHHDLGQVKERILEQLAVTSLRQDGRAPILCFVGPPGVGKTSLGQSIARALARRFVRISLGGMYDEAELRGHRRTYVGALPGQILGGMKRAGALDPVFVLDEVDKLGRDFRGDPAAALMEALDPEQNGTFRDHYLGVPFDLSRVLFIATANTTETIPATLLDRMEVITLGGYAEDDKVHIARRHLLPRQIKANGLTPQTELRMDDECLRCVIRGYTREAGVRGLDRQVAALCRKHARTVAEGVLASRDATVSWIHEMLGPSTTDLEKPQLDNLPPGVAMGLAWTLNGGDVVEVEAVRLPRDKGEFTVTGQLGPVMQESLKAALTWLRANSEHYGISAEELRRYDLHIHVPALGVPKDGPSAGVVVAAALVSLFTGRPVKPRAAATGEITLTGRVLAVGGLKEKLLAAGRAGVTHVVLPAANRELVEFDVPAETRAQLDIHYAHTLDDVMEWMFEPPAVLRMVTESGAPRAASPRPTVGAA